MRGLLWDGELQVVDELELLPPGPGEVAVAVRAAGLCSSDLSVVTGKVPSPLPVILGHEAYGVIDDVGPGVPASRVGDEVVLTALAACGRCRQCVAGRPTRCPASAAQARIAYRRRGEPIYQFSSVGAFAERTVVRAGQAVPIAGLRPEVAAVLGCAVLTGVGAALNRAPVRIGGIALVIGAGGIGLNVVQGARLAGAATILVCEAEERKAPLARTMGATHVAITHSADDVAAAVREVAADGVDVAYECTGNPDLIHAAVAALAWGGTAVIIGLPAVGVEIALAPRQLYHDQALVGCRLGSADPARLLPDLAARYRRGEVLLDELVSDVVALDDAPALITSLRDRQVDRGVIRLG